MEGQFAQQVILQRMTWRAALNELPQNTYFLQGELVVGVFSLVAMDEVPAVKILIDKKTDFLQQLEVAVYGSLRGFKMTGQLPNGSTAALQQSDQLKYP
jgi:hypothetical protein